MQPKRLKSIYDKKLASNPRSPASKLKEDCITICQKGSDEAITPLKILDRVSNWNSFFQFPEDIIKVSRGLDRRKIGRSNGKNPII